VPMTRLYCVSRTDSLAPPMYKWQNLLRDCVTLS
jgi:hypothetical protein